MFRSEPVLHSALTPQLPLEIIYLIGEFTSRETRATLLRCNKRLHQVCTPLFYRDIDLRTPIQLVKLYMSEQAMQMLCNTKSMTINDAIFHHEEWKGIQGPLDSPDYLVRILLATVSLYRLEVHGTRSLDLFQQSPFASRASDYPGRLLSQVANPDFLPKLAIVVEGTLCVKLQPLCYGRPVIYFFGMLPCFLFTTIFPALNPTRLDHDRPILPHEAQRLTHSSGQVQSTPSAKDIGELVREITSTSLHPEIRMLMVNMCFADEVIHNRPAPIRDTLPWIETMLSAAGCFQITNLCISFRPEPAHQSSSAQHSTVEVLQRTLPVLAVVSFPRIIWCKWVPKAGETCSHPNLSNWTPDPLCTHPEALAWWLDALGLDVSGSQSHEALRHAAAQLRDAMRARHNETSVPNEERLYERLMAHTSS